jgi:hypothetical protein
MEKKIKFQLADRTGEPLNETVYECEVDIEVQLGRAIPLRPTQDSVIRIANVIVMRPRRIIKGSPGHPDLLEYVEPKGEGWSDVPFFEPIKIIE